MIRAILFDCFGVLYVDVRHSLYERFPDRRDQLHDLNGQADLGLIDKSTYITSVTTLTGIAEAELTQAMTSKLALNQPLVDYIQTTLKPRFKTGLVSNIGRQWMNDFFDESQQRDLFDVIVVSGDEGITKPNPIIFERAAHRLNLLPEECLMIDDRDDNCRGAEAAGMKSVLFTSNDALWNVLQTIDLR